MDLPEASVWDGSIGGIAIEIRGFLILVDLLVDDLTIKPVPLLMTTSITDRKYDAVPLWRYKYSPSALTVNRTQRRSANLGEVFLLCLSRLWLLFAAFLHWPG
jgi:hypothetical protein